MKKTQIDRAIDVLKTEIKERENLIARLQQLQSTRPTRKPRAAKPVDVARTA